MLQISWHSSGYSGLVAQLSQVVNVSVSPVCPAPPSPSTQVQTELVNRHQALGVSVLKRVAF